MRGGRRTGAGRPRGDRQHRICIRIMEETWILLQTINNKSAYIDDLIYCDLKHKQLFLDLDNNNKIGTK